MSRHFANIDVKGDLRVRKQVRGGLHVENVVTAEAFYLKDGGEVGTGGGGGSDPRFNTVTAEGFYVQSGGELGGEGLVTTRGLFDGIVTGEAFYLKTGGDLTTDFVTFQIETLRQKNYFMDLNAPYDFQIDSVTLRSESGTGVASFYVDPVGGTGAGRYGRPIEGLTDFYITQEKQIFEVDAYQIGEGDEWFMGVESVDAARDVVGSVKIGR